MNADKRAKHAAFNCKACVEDIQYSLKRQNISFIDKEKAKNPQAARIIVVKDNGGGMNAKVVRRLKTEFMANLREQQVSSHTKALFSSKNISIRSYRELRMKQNSRYQENPQKTHVGRLENYLFDRDMVDKHLEEKSNGSSDLGDKMIGKWEELARCAGVRRCGDQQPKTMNKAQVYLHINGSYTVLCIDYITISVMVIYTLVITSMNLFS